MIEKLDWDSLKHADVLALRRRFFSSVGMFVTRRCPLRCRHCSARASKDLSETIPVKEVRSWFNSINRSGRVALLALTGGEPFYEGELLREILRNARHHQIASSVVTSGFWASSSAKAREELDRLPPFPWIEISADEFHEEFVPLERIAFAATAALEREMVVVISLITYSDPYFKERLYDAMPDEVITNCRLVEGGVTPRGRALDNGLCSNHESESLGASACDHVHTPVVLWNGDVMSCCNEELFFEKENALRLGNLYESSFEDIYNKADRDFLLHALRTIGPMEVINRLVSRGTSVDVEPISGQMTCDVCKRIVLSKTIMREFEELSHDPVFRQEIAVARFLRYHEVMPA